MRLYWEIIFVLLTITLLTDVSAEQWTEEKLVLQGNERFAKSLYTVLAKSPGNVFFSPISVHALLSMVYQGAGGITQKPFENVLRISNPEKTAIGYKDIMTKLNSVKNATLLIANKVFLSQHYRLREEFNNVIVQNFFSEVELLDFSHPSTVASTVNSWVERKTNMKIKDAIDPATIEEVAGIILVNAIYFKGKWALPFEIENTEIKKFYLNDKDSIDVKMMQIRERFPYEYNSHLDAQILKLPYSNRAINLFIILPNEKNGIVNVEQKLETMDLSKLMADETSTKDVIVALPKFKIEQSIDLMKSLTEIGLGDIFKKTTNFSGMIESLSPILVNKVVHRAFIEVNEEGTEAAAFTGFKGKLGIANFQPPVEFIADHPFLIVLRYKQDDIVVPGAVFTGDEEANILFVGRISNPNYTN